MDQLAPSGSGWHQRIIRVSFSGELDNLAGSSLVDGAAILKI
jgi:hypothetical protein